MSIRRDRHAHRNNPEGVVDSNTLQNNLESKEDRFMTLLNNSYGQLGTKDEDIYKAIGIGLNIQDEKHQERTSKAEELTRSSIDTMSEQDIFRDAGVYRDFHKASVDTIVEIARGVARRYVGGLMAGNRSHWGVESHFGHFSNPTVGKSDFTGQILRESFIAQKEAIEARKPPTPLAPISCRLSRVSLAMLLTKAANHTASKTEILPAVVGYLETLRYQRDSLGWESYTEYTDCEGGYVDEFVIANTKPNNRTLNHLLDNMK